MPNGNLCHGCRYGMGSVCYLPGIPRVCHLGLYHWCLDREMGQSLGLRLALQQAHEVAARAAEAGGL